MPGKMPIFQNFNIQFDVELYVSEGAIIPDEEIFQWMDDIACNDKVRFGFKYPDGKNDCCVSATYQPRQYTGDDMVCITAWGKNAFSGLRKLWIILTVWDALESETAAWHVCQAENQRIREQISAMLKKAR